MAMPSKYCKLCGRKLTNIEYINIGYGKKCYEKILKIKKKNQKLE